MHVVIVLMRVLEWLFLAGLAGSAVVVVISFVEDLAVLVGSDKKPH